MGFGPKSEGVSLGQQVAKSGSFKYLGGGEHDIKIAGVDLNDLRAKSTVTFKLVNDQGQEHNQMVYVTETDRKTGKERWGWRFSQLLAAVIPSPEAYEAFEAEANAGNEKVLEAFIGMKCRVKLERQATGGKFGPAEEVAEGQYVVKDTKDGEVLGKGDTPDAAVAAAEDKGYKKAYWTVTKYMPTHGASNIEQFANSMRAVHAKPAPVATFPQVKKSPAPVNAGNLALKDIPF